jgi:hypothetical protein
MASDDRRQGGGRYIRRSSEFVAKYIRKKNAQNKEARKESVTEELYYVRNEGSGQRFIVVDKRL